jgi:hypothetical protein
MLQSDVYRLIKWSISLLQAIRTGEHDFAIKEIPNLSWTLTLAENLHFGWNPNSHTSLQSSMLARIGDIPMPPGRYLFPSGPTGAPTAPARVTIPRRRFLPTENARFHKKSNFSNIDVSREETMHKHRHRPIIDHSFSP